MDDDQTKQQLLAGQTDLSDGEESDDEKRDRMIEDGAEEEEEQLLLAEDQRSVDVDGSDGDSLVTQGRTPLAKVDIAQMSVAEMMSDKPRTRASKLRHQRASGIAVDDERDKFREIVTLNPYKYRRILTPQQVKELYSDDDGKRKRSGGGGDVDDELVEFTGSSHAVWQQEPDNVYEIINLLREIGLKTNQSSAVWPYTEFMQQPGGGGADDEATSIVDGGGGDDGADSKELAVLGAGNGLNPQPDTFNDCYLLFARFPEILSTEIDDIRRKFSCSYFRHSSR